MSLTINTNINSLVAQNNLNMSQSSLTSAIAQLSSGLRINSAADDAAGYAIGQRMNGQINGLNMASNNVNSGVSLVQTALGSLTSITNNIQSLMSLAVEAANGTNSTGDLTNLNTQAGARSRLKSTAWPVTLSSTASTCSTVPSPARCCRSAQTRATR